MKTDQCESLSKRTLRYAFNIIFTLTLINFALSQDGLSKCETICITISMFLSGLFLAKLLSNEIAKNQFKLSKIIYVALIVHLSLCYAGSMFYAFPVHGFPFDTWSIYDASRHILTNFGYMDMVRQCITYTHYGTAFPPLQPFLIALINQIWNIGIMASSFICFISSVLIVYFSSKLGRKLNNEIILSIGTLLLITYPVYIALQNSGNSQIIGFLFMYIFVYVSLTQVPNLKWVLILSTIAAFGLMNRFDFLPIAVTTVLLAPTVYATKTKKRSSYAFGLICSASIALIIISPWIIYSLTHFDSFFATDNSRRLLNIPDTWPQTYFPQSAPAPTICDDQLSWANAFLGRCFTSVYSLYSIYITYRIHSYLLIACVIIFSAKRLLRIRYPFFNSPYSPSASTSKKQSRTHSSSDVISIKQYKIYKAFFSVRQSIKENLLTLVDKVIAAPRTSFLLFVILCYEIMIIITGYGASRYHIPTISAITFMSLLYLKKCQIFQWLQARKRCRYIPMLLCSFPLLYAAKNAIPDECVAIKALLSPQTPQIHPTHQELAMSKYLKSVNATTVSMDDNPRFSPLCEQATTFIPHNIGPHSVTDFVHDFHISHIYTISDEMLSIFRKNFNTRDTPIQHLYELLPREDE